MKKINRKLKKSYVFNLYTRLFIDKNLNLFKKSWVLEQMGRFTNQRLSFILLLASTALLLYKSFFVGTIFGNYSVWFLLLLAALMTCDKKLIRSYKATLFLAGFVVFGAVSAVFASASGVPLVISLNGIFLSLIFPLYFVVASTFPKKYYRQLPFIIILVCLPLLLAGLWQFVSGMTTPQYWVSPVENLIKLRVYGWSDNPNNLGAIAMVSGLVASFAFWLSKKWYFAFYAILAAFITVMTFSRTSWLGWGLALVIVLLIRNWRYLFLSIFALLGLLVPSVKQRFFATFDSGFLRDSALDGRIWTVKGIVHIFKQSPFFGIGPGTYGNAIARDYISPAYKMLPQNGFVASYMVDMQWQQILCQYGVIGILMISGFFISYFVNMSRRYFESKNIVYLASIVFLGVMLLSGFLENVWFFAPLAALYGIILGSGLGYANNK